MRYTSAVIALAGLVSFLAGWSFVEKEPEPVAPGSESVLVVRPLNATVKARSLTLGERPGEFHGVLKGQGVEISREGWPSLERVLESPEPVFALRLSPPPAKLRAVTAEGEVVNFRLLPSKEELSSKGLYLHLEPGHYELLAEAQGYVPERVPLDLKPGEMRELTLNLKRLLVPDPIPKPQPSIPTVAPQPRPYSPPQVSAPPAPAPAPVPKPRFTPIEPPPRPTVPEPFFTPIP